MRRLALVLIALLASCVITPNPSQEIETRWSKMIKGKSYPAYPYKKTDILKNEFDFRTEDQNYWIQYYLNLGYEIYDVPLKGGFTRLSDTSGKKYLCVWKTVSPRVLATAVTGTAQAGADNTTTSIKLAAGDTAATDAYKGCVVELTGGTGSGKFGICSGNNSTTKKLTVYVAWEGGITPDNTTQYKIGAYDQIESGDISIHTDVVIIGAKINAYNQVEQASYNTTGLFTAFPYFALYFYMAASVDLSHKLTILNSYCFLRTSDTSSRILSNLTLKDSYVVNYSDNSLPPYLNIRNSTVIGCEFHMFPTKVYAIICGGDESFVNNVVIDCGLSLYVTSGDFKNNYISGGGLYGAMTTSNNTGNYIGTILTIDATFSSTYLITIYGDWITAGSTTSILFKKVSDSFNPLTHKTAQGYAMLKFDSSIDFTTFKKLEGDFGVEYVQNNTIASNPIRNYYTLTFNPAYEVNDALKKFSKDLYYFCVQRDDFEEVLIPVAGAKKVLNLGLYDNDGTTAFSYDNDENFLILAKDASNNYAVFIWFNNALYRTAISDVFDGVTYTIEHCFQLWEIDSMNGVKQEISSDSVTNLPMSGSIRFNNIDNEIVIR